MSTAIRPALIRMLNAVGVLAGGVVLEVALKRLGVHPEIIAGLFFVLSFVWIVVARRRGQSLVRRMYFWVAYLILVCGTVAYFHPSIGVKMQPGADAFVGLVKMVVITVVFFAIAVGIGGGEKGRKLGRLFATTGVYFVVMTILPLVEGFFVVIWFRPGDGMNIDPSTIDASKTAHIAKQAAEFSFTKYLVEAIPKTFFSALTQELMLPVILVAVLTGLVVLRLRHSNDAKVSADGEALMRALHLGHRFFFTLIALIMFFAPFGAGMSMGFTIGKFGLGSLVKLGSFVLLFYATCIFHIVVVLGVLARIFIGFNMLKFIRYMSKELWVIIGVSSSDVVLAELIEKLERLGCSKEVVAVVVPAGHSFNLEGTCIYMMLAIGFLGQALNIHMTNGEYFALLLVALISSKGAAGVAGSGFATLAATLQSAGRIPVAAMSLILGIDKFMSEARALTNHLSNGVAGVFMSALWGELDKKKLLAELDRGPRDEEHEADAREGKVSSLRPPPPESQAA